DICISTEHELAGKYEITICVICIKGDQTSLFNVPFFSTAAANEPADKRRAVFDTSFLCRIHLVVLFHCFRCSADFTLTFDEHIPCEVFRFTVCLCAVFAEANVQFSHRLTYPYPL